MLNGKCETEEGAIKELRNFYDSDYCNYLLRFTSNHQNRKYLGVNCDRTFNKRTIFN